MSLETDGLNSEETSPVVNQEEERVLQGGESAAPALPREVLDAMVDAIQQFEESKGLPVSLLQEIAAESFALGRLNDEEWVINRLSSIDKEALDHIEAEMPTEAQREVAALLAGEPTEEDEGEEKSAVQKISISETATVESQEDLVEVVRVHEIWIKSILDPKSLSNEGRANLRGLDLSGYDFSGMDLSCADLRDTVLTGALFKGTNLSNAWLQNANFQGADITGAKLKRAKVEGAIFEEADMEGVDFSGTELENGDASIGLAIESTPESTL